MTVFASQSLIEGPQYQSTDRIITAAATHDIAGLFQQQRSFGIRREEHIEGSAVDNLGIELARRSAADSNRDAGLPGERCGNLFSGYGKIARHGNRHHVVRKKEAWQQCHQEAKDASSPGNGQHASGHKLRFFLPTIAMQERLCITVGLVTAFEHQCTGGLKSDA